MPVDDHAIHPSVRHTDIKAGCHSKDASELRPSYKTFVGEHVQHEMSYSCRQIGRKYNNLSC